MERPLMSAALFWFHEERRVSEKKGFSVLELLIVVALLMLIGTGAFLLIRSSKQACDSGTPKLEAIGEAQMALMTLEKDIREAARIVKPAPVPLDRQILPQDPDFSSFRVLELKKAIPDLSAIPSGKESLVFTETTVRYTVREARSDRERGPLVLEREEGEEKTVVGEGFASIFFKTLVPEEANQTGQRKFGTGPNTVHIHVETARDSTGGQGGFSMKFDTCIQARAVGSVQ